MRRYDTVSFVSDLGVADEAVGLVKSVLRTRAPHVAVIDITHSIAPHDVRSAALLLARSAEHLERGVVLVAVGTTGLLERHLAVEIGDGESVLVGPDNGVLAPLVALVGGSSRIVEIVPEAGASPLAVARDVYAPVGAAICNGVDIDSLGERLDPSTLVPAVVPFSTSRDGSIDADVLHVDNFGNAYLNVTRDQMVDGVEAVTIRAGNASFEARFVDSLSDLGRDQTGIILSDGLLVIVSTEKSAAVRHALSVDTTVSIEMRRDAN